MHAIDLAARIVVYMRDFEHIACSCCTGRAGGGCGNIECMTAFATIAKKIVEAENVNRGAS